MRRCPRCAWWRRAMARADARRRAQPNLLRLLVGEEAALGLGVEPIAVIETVIDDSSPQLLAYVSELLLEAGAWDVYRATVQMKKGRTGVQMTVLCRPDLVPALRDLMLRETTTIGLHWRLENKAVAGAGVCGGGDGVGRGAHQDCALARRARWRTRRRSMRTAG